MVRYYLGSIDVMFSNVSNDTFLSESGDIICLFFCGPCFEVQMWSKCTSNVVHS